ncbi:transposase [Bacillus subtilis]|uniref:transposase n=1 Tax=Bacillus subtilis TaxID=1423 RepID=UPI0011AD7935|nr:transposase [Bacillus subtilis]TWP03039.1 transposase [Bacillus subtilis]
MQRRKHSAEFKQQVVQEAIETGNKALVARRHELSPNLVSKWVKAFQEKGNLDHSGGVQSGKCGFTTLSPFPRLFPQF